MSMPAPITPIEPNQNAEVTNEDLLARRATLKADQEYIADELERIDAELIRRLGVGIHQVGDQKVQVREYTRTDPKAIAADYPVGEYPLLYDMALDMDAVKKQFSPAALEQYTVRGKKSVVVKP